MIVVDTSVLVDYFKGVENPPVLMLERLLDEQALLGIPAICCQEVLQGARDKKEWQTLYRYLSTQELLTFADAVASHMAAARIFYDCRRTGITLRGSVDCMVAQLVLENDSVLLHNDRDFEKIAAVRPLRLWDAV